MAKKLKLENIKKNQFGNNPAVMVIGFFDGVHRGHQKIIEMCNARSREKNGLAIALTFDRPPLNILKNKIYKKLILPYEEKIEIIESLGIDIIATAGADIGFLNLSPEEFCNNILIGIFDTKELFIGRGFRFGHNGSGDVGFLKQYLGKYGIKVNEVDLIESRGEIISSTAIRKYYKKSDIERIKEFLGRNPYIKGKVIKGAGRGRKLGFPTANIDVCNSLVVPGDGVYFGRLSVSGLAEEGLAAVINIGDNPTFDGSKKWVESHILDFNENIYGKDIKVFILKKLRKEIKFDSGGQLINQIEKDLKDARAFFNNDKQ